MVPHHPFGSLSPCVTPFNSEVPIALPTFIGQGKLLARETLALLHGLSLASVLELHVHAHFWGPS